MSQKKMNLPSGEKAKQQNYHLVHPDDIIVKPELNGRTEEHSWPEIQELAESMHNYGQLQPVQVRRVAEDRLQLVYGYRRYSAAKHILEKLDENFRLKVIVVDCSDAEAFVKNVIENKQRKETTPIDDAFNMRRLREEYGYEDDEIIKVFSCSKPWLGVLEKLLRLPKQIQKLVASGDIKVSVAKDLADLDSEEAMLEAAGLAEGKAEKKGSKEIKEGMREQGKSVKRTPKEVKEFLLGLNDDYAKAIMGYADGKLSEGEAFTQIQNFLGLPSIDSEEEE